MSDAKKPVMSTFTLGFNQVRKEFMLMRPAGCYWVTTNIAEDARTLARQCMSTRHAVALVSSVSQPEEILPHLSTSHPLIALPESCEAIMSLTDELAKRLPLKPGIILFFTSASLWEKLSADARHAWMKKTQSFVSAHKITLLILTTGAEINRLRPQLQTFYRYLEGLSHLNRQQNSWDYRISWWTDRENMLTDQTLRLSLKAGRFTLINQQQAPSPATNDEHLCLAEKSVLEGAAPLSSEWSLFEDNAELCSRAQQADAATIVFSLHHSSQVAGLASDIHHLRRQRGGALKIVVREMQAALRYSDQRLLLACGVNAIVSFSAPFTRLLATLEGLQGHAFNRHVPADLSALLKTMLSLPERGYLPPETFSHSVTQLINNMLLPENGKGILVALRTHPSLTPVQPLECCKPRRFGDLVTLTDDIIWLFLTSCRANDLDTALKFIFRRPHHEMFSRREAWCEDVQILTCIRERINPALASPRHTSASAAESEHHNPLRSSSPDKPPTDDTP